MTPPFPPVPEALPSRRHFLENGARVVAGVSLTPLWPGGSAAAEAEPKSPHAGKAQRIIVIGGGMAGLTCAHELVERGHDVTVLEASRRTGGHVKTLREGLPDGLYADAGAEHFTRPGYDHYWKYVEKFDLPVLPWKRRRDIYRHIDGEWHTEAQLSDGKVLQRFGFHDREIDYLREHGWTELASLYFDLHTKRFTDEYQPFGVGLDDLDRITLGDWLTKEGASDAAVRFCGGRRTSGDKPATRNDVSALFRLWQAAAVRLRGLPNFKREVFHLKGGNQLLPDTFAGLLGDRVRKNSPVKAILHDDHGVKVRYLENGRQAEVLVDQVVLCVSPLLLSTIKVTPAWPKEKAYALANVAMGMQSRVLLQSRTAFWKDDVPSINLETGNSLMSLVYQTAEEVEGESCLLMGSGRPAQSPEETLAAFRQFYPGKAADTIEKVVVHQWWKEEPTCFGCERLPFALGELAKLWPHLITPVGRVHFAGAAFDNLPWGMDAATRSANRVAEQIGGVEKA